MGRCGHVPTGFQSSVRGASLLNDHDMDLGGFPQEPLILQELTVPKIADKEEFLFDCPKRKDKAKGL